MKLLTFSALVHNTMAHKNQNPESEMTRSSTEEQKKKVIRSISTSKYTAYKLLLLLYSLTSSKKQNFNNLFVNLYERKFVKERNCYQKIVEFGKARFALGVNHQHRFYHACFLNILCLLMIPSPCVSSFWVLFSRSLLAVCILCYYLCLLQSFSNGSLLLDPRWIWFKSKA
jgi:hypothetical protein